MHAPAGSEYVSLAQQRTFLRGAYSPGARRRRDAPDSRTLASGKGDLAHNHLGLAVVPTRRQNDVPPHISCRRHDARSRDGPTDHAIAGKPRLPQLAPRSALRYSCVYFCRTKEFSIPAVPEMRAEDASVGPREDRPMNGINGTERCWPDPPTVLVEALDEAGLLGLPVRVRDGDGYFLGQPLQFLLLALAHRTPVDGASHRSSPRTARTKGTRAIHPSKCRRASFVRRCMPMQPIGASSCRSPYFVPLQVRAKSQRFQCHAASRSWSATASRLSLAFIAG